MWEAVGIVQNVFPEIIRSVIISFSLGLRIGEPFLQFVAIEYADINLVRLPDELDFVTAASLGCRFSTAFRAIVAQGKVGGGEFVAVHGCGGVGLSAIMIAHALGANVIGIDINPQQLELAKALGAVATINAT